MGSKAYTDAVLGIIDPKVQFFSRKVLCRDDGQREVFLKSVAHLSSGMDGEEPLDSDAIVVLDDRKAAWDEQSRPYILQVPAFNSARAVDGADARAEAMPDTALLDMLTVLRAVHRDWANGASPNAAAALQARRQAVLQDVQIVLSGGLIHDQYNPKQSQHWQVAEECGARCHLVWDAKLLSHVVSAKRGTSSVERAHAAGIPAVSDTWLLDSAARWCKQAEHFYFCEEERARKVPLPPASELSREAVVEAAIRRIPQHLSQTVRLKAAIKLVVPQRLKRHAQKLLLDFDRSLEGGDQEAKAQTLLHIRDLVGSDARLRFVMRCLGLDIPDSSPDGSPDSSP